MRTLLTYREEEAGRPDGKPWSKLTFIPKTVGLMCYLTTRWGHFIFMISLAPTVLLAHWHLYHMLMYWFQEKLSFYSFYTYKGEVWKPHGKKCGIQNTQPNQVFHFCSKNASCAVSVQILNWSFTFLSAGPLECTEKGLIPSVQSVHVILHTNSGALRTPLAHPLSPRVTQWTPCFRSLP